MSASNGLASNNGDRTASVGETAGGEGGEDASHSGSFN